MSFTVQNIYGLVIRSKLLPLEEAKRMYDRWQVEAKAHVNNLDQFTRWLVGNHYLTDYQVALLKKGHADGFFLGGYKILDRLGRGRMAGVYKAMHKLGQVVAIKVLPPSKAKDPQLFGRFKREARLAMKLKHPNVVRSFQIGEQGGLHFIVMEYLDGETLEDVLHRRKKLPPPEAVRLIYQALLGLQHIYEQGLVHRDLKPSNLMLVPARASGQPETTLNATVKILDIGLGRAFFDENAPATGFIDPQLTGEGVLLGTPDYLAPEQARNARAVDIRADIYSLGCVLYHALAGKTPFPESNIITQMIRHATENARPLKEISPEVPDGLQLIINYMMAKDPAQRYPTPERAAQALQVFLAAGTDPGRPQQESPQLTSYLKWLDRHNGERRSSSKRRKTGHSKHGNMRIKEPPPVKEMAAAPSRERKHRSKKHRHKSSRAEKPVPAAPPVPAQPPAPVAAPPLGAAPLMIDVELVPVTAPAPAPPPMPRPPRKGPLGLTRRDWVVLGIGAAGVLLAAGLGWLVAKLAG
jgi:serine/threonine protein kinase